MNNFKFNFLSRNQLESLSLDKFFSTVFKIIPCHEVFLGNLIFAIIAQMFCGNHLKYFTVLFYIFLKLKI